MNMHRNTHKKAIHIFYDKKYVNLVMLYILQYHQNFPDV